LISFILIRIKERSNYLVFSSLTFLFIVGLLLNIYLTRSHVQKLSEVSIERVSVLDQLSAIYPSLKQKNIFFITGDQNFYLSEGNNLPFQQGTGYTLLTWYGKEDNRVNKLLDSGTLWDLGSQGYYKDGSFEFGYFWD